jgi:hypothetical protein
MSRRALVVAALLALPACRERPTMPAGGADAGEAPARAPAAEAPATDAAPAVLADTVEVRGQGGAPRLALTREAGEWRVTVPGDAGAPLRIHADGDLLVVDDAAGARVGAIRPGPAGPELVDEKGQPVCRLVALAETSFDLVGPDGVALLRTRRSEGQPTVGRDAGGRPVLAARREGAAIVVADRDGAPLATVTGLGDDHAALVLASDALPPRLRALAAAWRLAQRP